MVEKLINFLLPSLGYRIVSSEDLDRLTYAAKHQSQKKLDVPLTAMELKKQMLKGRHELVIFDVGAYVGNTVQEYLESFPGSIIYAFEPTSSSFSTLLKRYEGNTSVKCRELGISDEEGVSTFHINKFGPTNSLLNADPQAGKYWGDGLVEPDSEISVRTSTLAKVLAEEGLNKVDLLKLDIQGAELSALRGAEPLLNAGRIELIYLEIIFVPTYVNQTKLFEVEKFLYDFGYEISGIFNLAYGRKLKQVDVLFSKSKIERSSI